MAETNLNARLEAFCDGVFAIAFILSFGVILITWVNHRGTLRMVSPSSTSFMYANGLLLLTVVFIPFSTSLLGAFIPTDHAAPAVVLYEGVMAVQAIGWLFVSGTALSNSLVDAPWESTMRDHKRVAYFAVALYGVLAPVGFWFPVAVAVVTTGSWILWLTRGVRMKNAD